MAKIQFPGWFKNETILISAPTGITVTPKGVTGSTSYAYYIVAKDWKGNKSQKSAAVIINNGVAVLGNQNYNEIKWPAIPGAVMYDVLRGTEAIATDLYATTFKDVGTGGDNSYEEPVKNETGIERITHNMIIADGLSILPETANGATLGTKEKPFKDVFIGPNSLYVDGNKVIDSQNTTLNVTTDVDQHLAVSTSGLGTTRLASGKEVILYSGDDINIQALGDITATSKGRITYKTDIDGQDILFQTDGTLSNITFRSKNGINFDAINNVSFTNVPKVNGKNILTVDDKFNLSPATAITIGGIKSGGDITVDIDGIVSVIDNSHNHTMTNITGLSAALTSKSDVGHTHDFSVLTNKPTTLSGFGITDAVKASNVGTAASKNVGTSSGNVPVLDVNGKLDGSILPAIAITDTFVIANEFEMLALVAQIGDVAIRTDLNKSLILKSADPAVLGNWQELLTPTDSVLSVNGKTGAVSLNASDVGLGNVTNESKATMFASPSFTGTPFAPTASTNNNGTQIATTGFVKSQNYLTGNQTVTVSGDATGSGTTSIDLTLANSGVVAGTYSKLTVNAKGLVTGSSILTNTDIPNLDWSKITSGKPTTVAGYGITDAALAGHVHAFAELTGKPVTVSGYGITDAMLNSNGVPSISAGLEASRPAFGNAGRVYIATDTKKIYRDNGVVWDQIGGTDTVSWSTVTGKPTTLSGYGISDAVLSSDVVTAATANKILKLDANGNLPTSITGNAATASSVAWSGVSSKPTTLSGYGITDAAGTAHTHSLTVSGDATGTVSLDNIADTMALTLANSGAIAGTYKSVTVDAKGRVTGGTNPTTLSGYGISDAVLSSDVVTTATANKILKLDASSKLPASITGNADGNSGTATKLQTARSIGHSGDVTGSATFDGSGDVSIAMTLANAGTTGTYTKVTTDAKGRVTSGTTLLATDIPVLDWGKITTGKPTTASGYGITLVASDIPTLSLAKISDAGNVASKNVGTAAGNVPILDSSGKLDTAVLPALAITDTFVVADQTSMLALTAQIGDVAIRTDLNKSFILKTTGASTLANWQELLTPTDSVLSVNGKTGTVTLTASDVGLGNVTNESKATMFTSPSFTGTPVASTPATADNSTQVATTAFVKAQSYLTGNQTVTVSGDASGSGTTAISLTLANAGTTGTYTKVTTDTKGRVTSGTTLSATDIPNIDWSKITTGKPTTVSGYGITLVASDIPTLTLAKVSDAGTAASKNVGTASGNVPVLDGSGKLDTNVLPAIAITDTFVVADQTSMLALTAQIGDVAIRTDLSKSFILKTTGASTLVNWQELLTPTDTVSSVAGKTGAVTLTSSDVGLGNVANESKATMFTSPSFTGTPLASTPATADNSTQVATTAFVKAQSYLTGNQTVTVSGDASGSGTTAIALTLANVGTAGTYTKVTTDTKGRVTSGTTLLATDIPNLDWGKITTGKPTTASGYGITLTSSDIPTLTLAKVSDAGTAASKNVGTASGNVPVLDGSGKLDTNVLPALAITDTFVIADQASMLALTAQIGDVAIRTDLSKSFILKTTGASTLANWQELLTPTDSVSSVAGKTGAVTLTSSDVGLSNVTNESKATMFTNAALTGTPTAPTAAVATNTAQVATTSFVKSQNYLTGNQTVTVSGDASGSGTTAIALTLADVSTAGTYKSVTVDTKGRVTAGTNPTTLSGYGITDAAGTAHTHSLTVSGDATGTVSLDNTADTMALTLANAGTAGTYTKVTTDTKGRVTSGASLVATDIPNLDWSKITTGKPTTISGYGITDGMSTSGSNMTGALSFGNKFSIQYNSTENSLDFIAL